MRVADATTSGRRSKIRAPKVALFPAYVPKAGKAKRRPAVKKKLIPTYIRAVDVDVTPEDRTYLRKKLERRLGNFARHIDRVSVRIKDLNGPRGGKDKACRIKVVLRRLPSIITESRSASLQLAMDEALSQVGKAVKRATERRQTTRRRVKTAADSLH